MISCEALTKTYGDRIAVSDMTFTAPPGKVTGFLGPNGAGKTTTFRMILGLARPTSGTSMIAGRAYADLERPRQDVGAVLEASGFHPSRTGRNHLRVLAAAAGFTPDRVEEVLALVGLIAAADKRVGRYSMGMRQRLALAAALLGDPGVLILDEPTNGLDPQGVAWLRGLLRTLADEGRTVLVSSHLLAEVAQIVDHFIIIRDGRVVHQGDTGSLQQTSGHRLRCADPHRLAALLETEGVECIAESEHQLTVYGATSEHIGQVAAGAAVPVFELTASSTTSNLESLFLELTDGAEVA
ncbi:MAG: ATP-binding cassette domain-containing protein [Nocardioides sp.]